MRNFSYLSFVLVTVGGCGSQAQGETPYSPGEVTVIGTGQGGEALILAAPCVGDECEALEEYCDDQPAGDIILDDEGNVVDVLCYKQDVQVQEVNTDEVERVSAGNKTVVVLDGEDDGLDVTEDVVIEGNNVVIYGSGPDVSVIGGTLQVKKNNAVVRGVKVLGDVAITKNNTQLAFCEIEGDLTITGNNTTMAECTVHGVLTIRGQNTILVQNRLKDAEEIAGFNLECNGNSGFADGVFEMDAGAEEWPLDCVDADGPPSPQSEVELDAGL